MGDKGECPPPVRSEKNGLRNKLQIVLTAVIMKTWAFCIIHQQRNEHISQMPRSGERTFPSKHKTRLDAMPAVTGALSSALRLLKTYLHSTMSHRTYVTTGPE